jgi:hypothetical protein
VLFVSLNTLLVDHGIRFHELDHHFFDLITKSWVLDRDKCSRLYNRLAIPEFVPVASVRISYSLADILSLSDVNWAVANIVQNIDSRTCRQTIGVMGIEVRERANTLDLKVSLFG